MLGGCDCLRIDIHRRPQRGMGSEDVGKYVAAAERSKTRDDVVERGGGDKRLGVQFFGRGFLNEVDKSTNIEVRTKLFTMSRIPVIPIAFYRFKYANESRSLFSTNTQRIVISQVPPWWPQVFLTSAETAPVIIGAGLLIVGLAEWWVRAKPN